MQRMRSVGDSGRVLYIALNHCFYSVPYSPLEELVNQLTLLNSTIVYGDFDNNNYKERLKTNRYFFDCFHTLLTEKLNIRRDFFRK